MSPTSHSTRLRPVHLALGIGIVVAGLAGTLGLASLSTAQPNPVEAPSSSPSAADDSSAQAVDAASAQAVDTVPAPMDANDPSIAPPETPAELSVQVTPWNDEDRDALRNSIESLGLAVDRIDLLTPMPDDGLIAATSPSLVDGALVDPRSNNTITFTIGQYVDELPRDSVPLVERFHAIEVPGAGEALHLTTEEYSQFVLVQEGGGPLIVVTVSPGLPGAGEALSDDSVKLAQDQLLSLLLSDGEA